MSTCLVLQGHGLIPTTAKYKNQGRAHTDRIRAAFVECHDQLGMVTRAHNSHTQKEEAGRLRVKVIFTYIARLRLA